MKKLSLLDKLFYIINSILAVLLLLAYLFVYISPKIFPIFTVISLFVPVLIIINIFFSIYWIFKLKKHFFLSLIILVIGYFISSPFFKITDKNSAYTKDLKIMTFNVRGHINMYNKKSTFKSGYKFIKYQNPDILLFQENSVQNVDRLQYQYKFNNKRTPENRFGMTIHSKYPIVNSGSLNLKSKGNNIIFADIVKDKDTIRIYNIHLESLRIQPKKENFGEQSSEKLLQRVKKAFVKQAEQVEIFLNHQKNWKGKLIVAGDFNNTAYSWVYKQIANNKKDAFIEAGKGFGKTYNYWFPMRIDFILTDNTATVQKFETFNDEVFSDHFPILARVNW